MKPINQINVIPFIDVMLVLLAIVLTTATFIAQGTIPVNLPQAEHTTTISETDFTEIVINERGVYYWDDQAITKDILGQKLAELSKQAHIVLKVDATARFEAFVGVVDQLKGQKLENVSIVAERR